MQGGGSVENKMFSPSFTFQNQLPQKQSSGSNGTDHSSLSFTPSPCSCTEEEINPSDTENRLYLARLSLQYQQLVDRYTLCITQLQDTANQGELLRQENAKLRVANKDLTKRLAILTQASIQTRYMSSNVPSLSIINDFRSLCLGDNGRAANEVKETSPTSMIGNNRFEKKNTERVAMPKSISIRSSGYLRMPPSSSGSSSTTGANIPNQPRAAVTTPVANDMKLEQQQQRLFVPVSNKEEGPMEFDVYNQGMVKTELCNKWQETGACPYGEHCQFAHGIAELRPVIRHPRYKTEVCRMVLSGDNCPYGHRCHFRHSLTEQERLTRRS